MIQLIQLISSCNYPSFNEMSVVCVEAGKTHSHAQFSTSPSPEAEHAGVNVNLHLKYTH